MVAAGVGVQHERKVVTVLFADLVSFTSRSEHLWLGQALARENLRPQADAELAQALAFYRSVGATRYIRMAESLVTASA